MRLPNFLIIGAMKSGTTVLYDALTQHPQVFMSGIKEPGFFCVDDHGEVVAALEGAEPYALNLASYRRLFDDAGRAIAIGEASTAYLHTPGTAERIYALIPAAKLICVLRNPIERAYSHFLFLTRKGIENIADFTTALAMEEQRVTQQLPFGHYTRIGFYSQHLQRYFSVFPRAQMGIYFFEDLIKRPDTFYPEVCRFLGVSDEFQPDTTIRRNPSGLPKRKWLNDLISKPNPVRDFVQPRLPRRLYKLATTLRDRNLARPSMPLAARRRLAALYGPEIEALQTLLGRDLSHWLEDVQ